MILLLLACSEDDVGRVGDDDDDDDLARPEVELADMALWAPGAGADPFDDGDGDCPIGATFLEGNSIEIDTGSCTYLWVEQPLLADLAPGDAVELVYWHSDLVSDLPATAHLALAADGQVIYENTVPIPLGATAYTEQAEITVDVPEGAPLVLHLHNHGANTWNLLRVTRK